MRCRTLRARYGKLLTHRHDEWVATQVGLLTASAVEELRLTLGAGWL